MRFLFSIVLYLALYPTFAQEPIILSGKVTNQSTGESLQYVNIYLEGTSDGTTTNRSGEFIFRIPPETVSLRLVISHLGFKQSKIDLLKSPNEYLNISLVPEILKLSEVVIQPLDPVEIIYSTIERIPINYYSHPYTAQSFQREYVTLGREFIQLSEVMLQTRGTTDSLSSKCLLLGTLRTNERRNLFGALPEKAFIHSAGRYLQVLNNLHKQRFWV